MPASASLHRRSCLVEGAVPTDPTLPHRHRGPSEFGHNGAWPFSRIAVITSCRPPLTRRSSSGAGWEPTSSCPSPARTAVSSTSPARCPARDGRSGPPRTRRPPDGVAGLPCLRVGTLRGSGQPGGDQGGGERHTGSVLRRRPVPGGRFDEPGEPLAHRPVVLGQDVDAQAAVDEGGDHLADAVVPLVGARAGQRSVSVGVGLLRFVDEGLVLLEVCLLYTSP